MEGHRLSDLSPLRVSKMFHTTSNRHEKTLSSTESLELTK